MGLILPGASVICIEKVTCPVCETTQATKGAIYLCTEVGMPAPDHDAHCLRSKCEGFILRLAGKTCGLCACCFAPLNDGDSSRVEDEVEDETKGAILHPVTRKELA